MKDLYKKYDEEEIYKRVTISPPGFNIKTPGALAKLGTMNIEMKQKDIMIVCAGSGIIELLMNELLKFPPKFEYKALRYMSSDEGADGNEKDIYTNPFYVPVKIIFSTNMIEAGSTNPTLYTIIDTGVRFSPCIFPLSG
jgi:hypothetical protein